jgi:type I restriction enzyme S subunit
VNEYWNGDINWLSLHDTKELSGHYIYNTQLKVTQAGINNSSARILPKGTVAISRTASIGNCVILGLDMATSQDYADYICGDRLDPEFLMLYFKHIQNVWTNLAQGSTHQTVYMPSFKRLQILLPPINEQKRIARTVIAVDRNIETLKIKKAALEKIKKGLMQDLLTGKVRVKV